MEEFIEVPACNISLSMRKPLYGVGINDAEYKVYMKNSKGPRVICPFYRVWVNMLSRVYDKKYQQRQPSYKGCTVSKEWLVFSQFKSWMNGQDWHGKALDKDILVIGNKIYSKETCIFVDGSINNLLLDTKANRGKYPLGVSFKKDNGLFFAQCAVGGRSKHLGFFSSTVEAAKAYNIFKAQIIMSIAKTQPPVLMAALNRRAELLLEAVL